MKESRKNLIARTLEVWQPRSARRLSEEDARKTAENVAGFFTLLLEWEASQQDKQVSADDDSYYAKSA
jgi:hypothetical protein